MKVIQVFNRRRDWGGEDHSIEDTTELLKRNGVEVLLWTRDVAELGNGLRGKLSAFLSGIYSRSSALAMRAVIQQEKPDVVHAHNLYPQLSASVLAACRRSNTPVIWHPHDYRPVCPTGLHLYNGSICERCCRGREYWCILRNCRRNMLESVAYSLRTYLARRLRLFQNNTTLVAVWAEFLKRRLVSAGFPDSRTVVIPHPIKIPALPDSRGPGEYVGYMGRISSEKGVNILLSAAQKLPDIPFRVAGDHSAMPDLADRAPMNVTFTGWQDRTEIPRFYQRARFTVIPSVWYEPFPTVALEAMSYRLPVIASRIGGIPEAVEDGVTGLLVEPGNATDLANRIQFLWHQPEPCRTMGEAARQSVITKYDERVYYDRLMEIYHRAIELVKEKKGFGDVG